MRFPVGLSLGGAVGGILETLEKAAVVAFSTGDGDVMRLRVILWMSLAIPGTIPAWRSVTR